MIRRADPRDAAALLGLMRLFGVEHGSGFDEARVSSALGPLLADPSLGVVLVACGDDGALAGYAVLTWGWSLESGGREALLDEIFVADRGRGTGSALLSAVIEAARAADAQALFLETEAPNDRVRRWYLRHGFEQESSVWLRLALGP